MGYHLVRQIRRIDRQMHRGVSLARVLLVLLQLREKGRQGHPEGLRYLQVGHDGDGHLALSISPYGPALPRGSSEPQTGNDLGGTTMPPGHVHPKGHDPFRLRRRYEAHAPKNAGTCSGGTGPEKW